MRADRDHEAALAVLCLGEQVQGDEFQVRVCAEGDHQVAGPGDAVDPDAVGELALGLLDVEVARPHDHLDARHALGPAGQRGDRLGAAHPVHALHAESRQVPRISGSISPPSPGGEQTQTSSTPAARAVTTPITAVLG